MGEHQEYEWQEKARWIKFEEDVEEGSARWGKPHVASLSFHSLLELRRCIEHGKLLLILVGVYRTWQVATYPGRGVDKGKRDLEKFP